MMSDDTKDYCAIHTRLEAAKLLNGGALTIAMRVNGSTYRRISFSANARSDESPEQELSSVSETSDVFGSIFASQKDVEAILFLSPRYCAEVSGTMKTLPACLDDLAQIVGINVRVAAAWSVVEVRRALKGRSACLIRDAGMLATGRTLNEAFVAALVLEKGARTYVLGKKIGGAKPIPPLAARLMRFVYKQKYSKINLEQEASKGAV